MDVLVCLGLCFVFLWAHACGQSENQKERKHEQSVAAMPL
jgi:nitrogen fixation-related uncharacterized protein